MFRNGLKAAFVALPISMSAFAGDDIFHVSSTPIKVNPEMVTSSGEEDGFPAKAAFDGYVKGESSPQEKIEGGAWKGAKDRFGHSWIAVDLEKQNTIKAFSVSISQSDSIPSNSPKDIALMMSDDGEKYRYVKFASVRSTGLHKVVLESPILTQHLKVKVINTWGDKKVLVDEVGFY